MIQILMDKNGNLATSWAILGGNPLISLRTVVQSGADGLVTVFLLPYHVAFVISRSEYIFRVLVL